MPPTPPTPKMLLLAVLHHFIFFLTVVNSQTSPDVFSPIVTATCRAGLMTIKLETLRNFAGVVQSRDHRKPQCSGYGENSKVTFLRVNMMAEEDDEDYCGVFLHKGSDEYSIAVAVRVHRTLETAKDKFYMITCGKAGFQNTRNETSLVNLELLQGEEKVDQVIYGRDYTLRARFSRPDGKFGMKVKRCFSFSDTNNTVELVDDRGCPRDPDIMSNFVYNNLDGVAMAKLYSMFKFPESNRVHFQCDILVCKGPCKTINCDESVPEARSLSDPSASLADALLEPSADGALMASYSVFVLEPGQRVEVAPVCSDEQCDVTRDWLFWLCIAFGFGFFLLLIIVVFLLSAVTCSCVSQEVDKDRKRRKESEAAAGGVEEFDPYAKSWHGSQYGSRFHLNSNGRHSSNGNGSVVNGNANNYATSSTSLRYSLNGAIKTMPVPYIPADNSNNSSNNSPITYDTSEYTHQYNRKPQHNGRPDSRYSGRSRNSSRTRSRSRPRSTSRHRNGGHPRSNGVTSSSASASSGGGANSSQGRLILS